MNFQRLFFRALLAVLVLTQQTACDLPIQSADERPAEAAIRMAFQEIGHAASTGVPEPMAVSIRSPGDWLLFWEDYARQTGRSGMPPPSVDFSRNMIVAVFSGMSMRSCGHMAVRSVSKHPGSTAIEIAYDSNPLPEKQACGLDVYTPASLVIMERSFAPIKLVKDAGNRET